MFSTRTGFHLLVAAGLALAAPQGTTPLPEANVTITVKDLPPGVTLANSAGLCFYECLYKPLDTKCTDEAPDAFDANCKCRDACYEKVCPDVKDEAAAFNKAACSASAQQLFTTFSCIMETCAPTLAEPIKTACGADALATGECACSSQAVHTALDGCIAANATCAGAAASAWLTYTTFCPMGNATMEIDFEASFDLNETFTGSLNPQPSETGAPQPGNGGDDGNGGKDGDNSANALRRGGLAAVLVVLSAVAAVAV